MTTIANVADQATAAAYVRGSSQKQTAFAGRTRSIWANLVYRAWRWYQVNRIEAALHHRSDRTLTDIGLERGETQRARIHALLDRQELGRERAAKVYSELMALNDAELEDIGVKRDDIRSIADAGYHVVVNAANPDTSPVRTGPAANDQRYIAAA